MTNPKSGEKVFERRQHFAVDATVDVAQYLRDGEPWDSFWPSLAEAYAELGIEIHVHFRAGFVEGGIAGDFCAVFNRTPPHEFDVVGGVAVAGSNEAKQPGREKDEVGQPMLVHVVKLVKPPEGVGLSEPISSCVRLQFLDNCLRTWVDAPKHLVEFRRVLLDLDRKTGGRLDLAGYRSPLITGDGKLKNEVVEGASEVVEAISDDEAEVGRRRVERFDAKDLLAAINIGFGPGSVRAFFNPGTNFGFKAVQVEERPFEPPLVVEDHGV